MVRVLIIAMGTASTGPIEVHISRDLELACARMGESVRTAAMAMDRLRSTAAFELAIARNERRLDAVDDMIDEVRACCGPFIRSGNRRGRGGLAYDLRVEMAQTARWARLSRDFGRTRYRGASWPWAAACARRERARPKIRGDRCRLLFVGRRCHGVRPLWFRERWCVG